MEPIKEATYPANFDMAKFKTLPTYKERVQYATANLPKIATGSGRAVYKIDDATVLKLAKNAKGIAQNGVENDWYLQDQYDHIVAKVLDSDKDDLWLESQLAKKISPGRFKQITGFDFNDFGKYITNYYYMSQGKKPFYSLSPEIEEKLGDDELTQQICYMMNELSMPAGDLARISSYGEIDNQVVLTDYGLNQNVWDEFYARKR